MLYCNVEQIALQIFQSAVPDRWRRDKFNEYEGQTDIIRVQYQHHTSVMLQQFSFLPREIVQEENDYIMPSTELF